MQKLIESTNLMLDDWKKRKDDIAKCQKELAENQQCIDTLQRNFQKLDCIEPLRNIVDARNADLKDMVADFDSVKGHLQNRHQTMKSLMIEMLELYKKINVAFTENFDDVLDEDTFAVEIAKMSYSNLIDNHNLRCDPPIATVLKDDFRYIKDVLP